MVESVFPNATEEQIKEGKSIAWLSYLNILFLIPLLVQPENPYTRYHARQGLMLFLVEVAVGIVWAILGSIAWAITVGTYGGAGICTILVSWILMPIIYVLLGILAIIGIIQSASGKFWRMPVFGPLGEKWFKNMVPGGGAAPPPPPPPPGPPGE